MVFVILFSPVFDPIHLIYHDVSIIHLFVCLVTSIFGNLLLFSLTSGLRQRSGFCRMASCLSVSDSIQDHSYAHVFLCKLLSHISSDVFWGWNMLLLSCTLSVSCCIWYSASATKSVASANSGSLSICPFSVTLAFTLHCSLWPPEASWTKLATMIHVYSYMPFSLFVWRFILCSIKDLLNSEHVCVKVRGITSIAWNVCFFICSFNILRWNTVGKLSR